MYDMDADVLDISMVLYHPDEAVLVEALASLETAAAALKAMENVDVRLWLVDNAERSEREGIKATVARSGIRLAPTILSGHGNLGYGGGHNLAIRCGTGAYHLVLNHDVILEDTALAEGVHYLRRHPETVMVSPRVVNEEGEREFICKRQPTVLDLALRGFAPSYVRALFARRLARYEMRDVTGDEPVSGIEQAGGAFMLCDRRTLTVLGGFDERFFLYFEDFDLSRRAAALGAVAYVPAVRIMHRGGKAAAKGWLHRRLFVASAWRYFAKHGVKLL
jgi:GT2 family glycosyltransferase